jgi:hypothetical protein
VDLNTWAEWAQIVSVLVVPVGAAIAYLRHRERKQDLRLDAMEHRQITSGHDIDMLKAQFVNDGNGTLRTAVDKALVQISAVHETTVDTNTKVDTALTQIAEVRGAFNQHIREGKD